MPSTCWYSNVRDNVTRSQWETCKSFVKERGGSQCEICGGVGSRYPVDCHEIWYYSDGLRVQKLLGLIALCPRCHEVKHIGRAERNGHMDRAYGHLMGINDWSDDVAFAYLGDAFDTWRLRSSHSWKLDISWLATLGLPTTARRS